MQYSASEDHQRSKRDHHDGRASGELSVVASNYFDGVSQCITKTNVHSNATFHFTIKQHVTWKSSVDLTLEMMLIIRSLIL
jgi:hypothetical protein